MKSSLGIRLLGAASISIVVALIATAITLNFLFRAYFEERIHAELESFLIQLTAHVGFDREDSATVSEMADPRFSEPLSGYYWQVQLEEAQPLQSASFWSEPLEIPRPDRRGDVRFVPADAGNGEQLVAGSWIISREHEGKEVELHLVVAINREQFEQPIVGFSRNVTTALGTLGIFLILASWVQVKVGLRPLDSMRREVNNVKEQPGSRLSHDHPTELVPLVEEVNDLLDQQQSTIQQSRDRASNLAHGLKTPLTIMRAISQELKGIGNPKLSEEVDSQVDNMQYFVERELARTRDQMQRDVWCQAGPVASKIVASFQRRQTGHELDWRLEVSENATCPFDEYALTELLGNLIDNATKWTRSEIKISISGDRHNGFITVRDDGPGVSEKMLEKILQRGERLDQSNQGQGLGLSIVEDMVSQRGCDLFLTNRAEGGLCVSISWAGIVRGNLLERGRGVRRIVG